MTTYYTKNGYGFVTARMIPRGTISDTDGTTTRIDIPEDTNEQIAEAFNAQVKKEHEAVFAFITKKGIKPL